MMKNALKEIAIVALLISVLIGAIVTGFGLGETTAYKNMCEGVVGGLWVNGSCVNPNAILYDDKGVIS